MKYLYCFYFTCLFSVFGLQNNCVIAQVNDGFKILETLLDQKEYFRLETQLALLKNNISEKDKLYFQCFLDAAFNHNAEAVRGIDNFLSKYIADLSDSLKAKLLLLQADSYYKRFQYAKAATNDSIVLALYSGSLRQRRIKEIENDLLARNALRNIPPQEILINNGTTIHWKRNIAGLVDIPVTFNKKEYKGLLDTKANYSCITESYAKELGLHMLDVSIEEGSGLTGIRFQNGLGVADSLSVGDILIRNAVFLVMPDDKLKFGLFSIHIIIGYPIIEELKEIQFYKNGEMTIPAKPSESNLHNLALDGLNPVIQAKSGNDTLCFDLDLGASETYLYATYFERYKESILKDGKHKSIKIGGAGGRADKDVYIIPRVDLLIDNKIATFWKQKVFTEKTNGSERYNGNLGQDFVRQFDGFILNFDAMYFRGL